MRKRVSKEDLEKLKKAASMIVPSISAATGAAINALFMDHFQDMAKGHFVVRRLERKYGNQLIEEAYKKI